MSGQAVNRRATRMLLEAGAEPDAADARGCTPLHVALRNERPDIAMILLDGGADSQCEGGP